MDYAELGAQTVSMSFPEIVNLTPTMVASLRRRCGDELLRLRTELNSLAHAVQTQPWEPGYVADVKKVVDTKVRPAVTELEKKLRSMRSEMGLRLIEKAITAAPLSLVVLNMTPGLPLEWTLPASVGLSWLKEGLEYRHKREAAKRNGLHFLLRLGTLKSVL